MMPVFRDFLFPSEYSLLFSQIPPELPVVGAGKALVLANQKNNEQCCQYAKSDQFFYNV